MKALELIKQLDRNGLLQSINNGCTIVELDTVFEDLMRLFGDHNIIVEPRKGTYLAIWFNIKDALGLGPADALIILEDGFNEVNNRQGVAFYRIDG